MSPLPPEVIAADAALSRHSPHRTPTSELEPLTDAELAELKEWQAGEQQRKERAEKREDEAREKRIYAAGMLGAWARANAKRDELVRAAHDAGISVHRIHRITGIARTTITRIISA